MITLLLLTTLFFLGTTIVCLIIIKEQKSLFLDLMNMYKKQITEYNNLSEELKK